MYQQTTGRHKRLVLLSPESDWYIDVWKTDTQRVMTLRSHHSDGWGLALSVCTVGDKFAVADCTSRTLDMFSMEGIIRILFTF